MKCILALSPVVAAGLVACDTMNSPISSGSFDPLSAPGSQLETVAVTSLAFTAGQFVRAAMNNTAFFNSKPSGNADADKVLTKGTSMKVISTSGSYAKVELDSGDIGFVPTVMLEDPNALPPAPLAGTNEYQVYPPLPMTGFGEPLPIIDPADLPPEGAIPTVIDPEAGDFPSVPVPEATPGADSFPTLPPVEESMPLPPNGEEIEAAAEENEIKAEVEPEVEGE